MYFYIMAVIFICIVIGIFVPLAISGFIASCDDVAITFQFCVRIQNMHVYTDLANIITDSGSV